MKKFKIILYLKKISLRINILYATFGYCLKYNTSSKDIMLQMLPTKYFNLFLKKIISYHNGKNIVEGIAYIGPILMR